MWLFLIAENGVNRAVEMHDLATFTQPSNAVGETHVSQLMSVTVLKLAHSANALSSTYCTYEGITTLVRDAQVAKHSRPKRVRLSGIAMSVMPDSRNAIGPMEVRQSGSVTDFRA